MKADHFTKETTDQTIATTCRKTGRRCFAAVLAADNLARAASYACVGQPDFAMTGQIQLEGCPQTCPALFTLTRARVEVFCGVEQDVNLAALTAFASGFLDTDRAFAGLGGLVAAPLALVRANVSGPAAAAYAR